MEVWTLTQEYLVADTWNLRHFNDEVYDWKWHLHILDAEFQKHPPDFIHPQLNKVHRLVLHLLLLVVTRLLPDEVLYLVVALTQHSQEDECLLQSDEFEIELLLFLHSLRSIGEPSGHGVVNIVIKVVGVRIIYLGGYFLFLLTKYMSGDAGSTTFYQVLKLSNQDVLLILFQNLENGSLVVLVLSQE